MKATLLRGAILAATVFIATVVVAADQHSYVVSIDLSDHQDFAHAQAIGIIPFSRVENIFLAEVNFDRYDRLQAASIPLELLDDRPFSGTYYLGTVESIVSRKIQSPDLVRLAEIGDYAFYKADEPLDRRAYRRHGFDPMELVRQEIPLVYFPTVSSNPRMVTGIESEDLDSLLAKVSQDTIYAYNQRLEDFVTRYTYSDSILPVREWIKGKLEGYGYTDVTYQEFWCPGYLYPAEGFAHNVICVKEGTTNPDQIIVIGGHYDATLGDGSDPWQVAPGADDDASGTAATMEIARVLANVDIRKTIIFILFGGEEQYIVGSRYYAGQAAASGMDIEVMLNLDMIGFTNFGATDLILAQGYTNSYPYADLMAQQGVQHTWLDPVVAAAPPADQLAFYENGYRALFVEEYIFNTAAYHTAQDLTDRLDFPYMTEATKMTLATAYVVSAYPAVIDDAFALDVGDGQSLQVEWTATNTPDIAGYRVYWGTSSANYSTYQDVAGSGTGVTTINGLTVGEQYFLTVVAVDTDDNESFIRPEFVGTPRLFPLAPAGVFAEPGEWQVELTWLPNAELDFNHYEIYRAEEGGSFALAVDDYSGTTYIDTDVAAGIMYEYKIAAVDDASNRSDYSTTVNAAAATFDQGILIIDRTPIGAGNPTAEQKTAFFATAFAGLDPDIYEFNPQTESLNKSIIGQYNAIFWIDDNNSGVSWNPADLAQMRWYLSHNTGLMIAGWRTGFSLTELHAYDTLSSGDFLFDYGAVTTFEEIYDVDCRGLLGEGDCPDAPLDPAKVFSIWEGKMGWIGTLEAGPTAEIVARFDSESGTHTGKIVGLRNLAAGSRFAFLSMPFYYLDDAGAQAIIADMADWFSLEIPCDCSNFCDLNLDGGINPVDVVLMVNYVYKNIDEIAQIGACPQNNGNWNCDAAVNPVDVVLYVNYVYKSMGNDPCDPCVP